MLPVGALPSCKIWFGVKVHTHHISTAQLQKCHVSVVTHVLVHAIMTVWYFLPFDDTEVRTCIHITTVYKRTRIPMHVQALSPPTLCFHGL